MKKKLPDTPGRGGLRAGAGRKKGSGGPATVAVTLRLKREVLEWLDGRPGKSRGEKLDKLRMQSAPP